ncbi:MAG: DUF6088 family protein [Bilifractor sp.]
MYEHEINEYITHTVCFDVNELRRDLKIHTDQYAAVNTTLARMTRKNILHRVAKGIYTVPITTCFGTGLPGNNVIADKLFIQDGNGYITGAAFLNELGISSWVPQVTEIKSNHYVKRVRIPGYLILKPVIQITRQNLRYLQILDAIDDYPKYAHDCSSPEQVIYNYLNNQFDIGFLFFLAHKYYPENAEKNLCRIMEEKYAVA